MTFPGYLFCLKLIWTIFEKNKAIKILELGVFFYCPNKIYFFNVLFPSSFSIVELGEYVLDLSS
jgi:hypothetical protein